MVGDSFLSERARHIWRHLHGVTRFRVGSRFVLLKIILGVIYSCMGWQAGKNITHCVLVAQRGVQRFVWGTFTLGVSSLLGISFHYRSGRTRLTHAVVQSIAVAILFLPFWREDLLYY